MGLFSCKHKEVKIIVCDKNARYYIVKCTKCNEQWQEPKAIGEIYDMLHTIKRG